MVRARTERVERLLQLKEYPMYGNDITDAESPGGDPTRAESKHGAKSSAEDEGLASIEERDGLHVAHGQCLDGPEQLVVSTHLVGLVGEGADLRRKTA